VLKSAFLAGLIFLLTACIGESRFPGFKMSESGFHYKFHAIGDGAAPKELDYVTITFNLREYKLGQGLIEPAFSDVTTIQLLPGKAFTNAMLSLIEGDSASFIFSKSEISELTANSNFDHPYFQLDLKLSKVITSKKYLERFKKLEKWLHQPGVDEEKLISEYLSGQSKKPDYFLHDIYFYEILKGSGKKIESGATVTIKYTGYLLDGRKFDELESPLSFDLNAEGQLIKGLEIAIKRMKKGSKTKIILPSHLAFGEMGSSNGLIAPKSPVVYEVELIRVNY
jgi:FKBP-type peptidyl-prolyl cis-trans isomerase FkpA